MGFFSWDCEMCGRSARCPMAVANTPIAHMSEVMVVFDNGDRISGEYDGYGKVGGSVDLQDMPNRFTLYHLRCWQELGAPGFKGQSRSSRDQGWFFDIEKDDGRHTLLD